MQTETIRVALRLRTPWEAVDLGISMVRSWWLPILASWLALFVPVALCVWLLAPSGRVAILALWWLKPLFDRAVLNVLAQGVFGPLPRWSDTLSALPALALGSGLFLSLVPLRLSPQRSLTLPILQLENLRGRAYGRRARTLSGRDVATAVGYTALCGSFELALVLGSALLAAQLLADPLGESFDLQQWVDKLTTPEWLFPLYVGALTLVEPFYVGGGFGLYLNRRIELEGWDIEVAFRSIARRHRRSFALRAAGALGALAVSSSALFAVAGAARAAASEPLRCAVERPADATPCIDRVLTTPEFDRKSEQGGWQLRRWVRELFEDDARRSEPSQLGQWIGSLLASSFRVAAWTLLVFGGLALVGALARYRLLRRLPGPRPGITAAPLPASEAASPARTPDLASAALARWSADPVGALGLLYTGVRAHLIERLEMALPEGATERECERAARRRTHGALADDFGALTRAWILCAYAARLPSAAAFRELCERWRGHLVST